MDHSHRPASLNLSISTPARPVSTSPSPTHRQSQSPFRYVQFNQDSDINEKQSTPLSDLKAERGQQSLSSPAGPSQTPLRATPTILFQPRPTRPGRLLPPSPPAGRPPLGLRPPTLIRPNRHLAPGSQPYSRPRGLRIANLLRPWLPIIFYAFTSLAFVVAIALYRTEVFAGLDELSKWLKTDEQFGQAVLFLLIFLTTFPPVPLYSTLIILAGYTFGPWTGAVLSYFAALTGALTVFIISRTLLRDTISRWLASTITIKRVVRAIEKRPKLLFLIRLAPYPYNVMNCLLAASPTLTLRTYTVCTALSLFKVIVHTSVGASIHSFKDYHVVVPGQDADAEEEDNANYVARMWTIIGVALCVVIFVYLSVVARRAVDDELDDETPTSDREERMAFLSGSGEGVRQMTESPFRSSHIVPSREWTSSS